jgi:hypothetical protein
MDAFQQILREDHFDVVILDPFYKVIGADADNMANATKIAQICGKIDDMCRDAGAIVFFNDHATKASQTNADGSRNRNGIGISGMQYGGLMRWARQWVLLTRLSDYEEDGKHDLLVEIGGSAGYAQKLEVHIEEGVRSKQGPPRHWKITTRSKPSAEERAEAQALIDHDIDQRVASYVSGCREKGCTWSSVNDALGLGPATTKASLRRLVNGRRIFVDSKHKGTGTWYVSECWRELVEVSSTNSEVRRGG